MSKFYSRLFFFVLCIVTTPTATAQQSLLDHACAGKQGNFTSNSTYQTNLYTLLSSLTFSGDFSTGFYVSSHGENPDKVYANGLCRGYVQPDDCRNCLNNAVQLLPQLCPNQKEAIGWYEKCTLHYSNRNLSGIMETDPFFDVSNGWNVSWDVNEFNRKLMALFEDLRSRAVAGGSSLKYAVGNATVSNESDMVYALVQCVPDLSGQDCDSCVATALGNLEKCCYGSLGAYVALPSCMVNYDLNNFYELDDNTPADQLPPPSNGTSAGKGKKKNTSPSVAIVVVPSVCAFLVLVISVCLHSRMRMGKKKLESKEEIDFAAECLQFDFGTISSATNYFSEENKLGQGGFGAVYRGRLSNGQEIAVKRMIMDADLFGQGYLEFKNEVGLVARLGHRNLVNLLGFCLEKNERLLVYELVQNSSLDRFIFDPIKRENLNWDGRFRIIMGIARGLLYLHEESRLKIIHRDLKAGNILLDAEMNPKIADFGTARLFAFDQSNERTRRIIGTFGYMAPEYARQGQFSVKSDVFSFGVLILEIVCGQNVKNFREGEDVENLLTYAWKCWNEGKAMNLADPTMKEASRHEIIRCIQIGLLCVQEKVADRPNMGSVVLMLSTNSPALQPPSRPAYFVRLSTCESEVTGSSQSENVYVPISHNVVSVTELSPR